VVTVANLDGLRTALSDKVLEISAAALATVVSETQDAAPEKTGALRASIHGSGPDLQGDFRATATIAADVAYAGYTDAGTPPHTIEGKPWLAFFWDLKGYWVISAERDGHPPMYVNHPGTTGTQWFNSGIDDGEPMASRWESALTDAAA
jgi:hypothetical protein